jgi:3-dehydroquinate dehydratase-2
MILLVNGPNLNLLGEGAGAGRESLADVERMVAQACAAYGREVKAFQSNWEGALIDFLQQHRGEAEGVIVNPGALAHTSLALAECLKALACPAVEVHLANVHAAEPPWRGSVVAPAALGHIAGLGAAGYYYAALHLCARLGAEAGVGARSAAGVAPAAAAAAAPVLGPRPGVEPPLRSRPSSPAAAPRPPPSAAPAGRDPDVHRPPTGGGDLGPVAPGEEIPVDMNSRGEYEPL